MRVLVTNDDGIDAPGILALARAIVAAGHDVVVAAPLDEMSGSGAAIGPVQMHEGVAFEAKSLPGLDGVPAFGVDGPPALAVMAARLGAFGDAPDMVLAGVNPGPNTGRSTLHSGTVGAALTAVGFGASGVAVSQVVGDPWHVETAAAFGAAAVQWVTTAPPKTVLNVNVPDRDLASVKGVRAAALAPFGIVRTVFEGTRGGRLLMTLQATDEPLDADTDTMLVQEGYVAVTVLTGIRAADPLDAPEALEKVLTRG